MKLLEELRKKLMNFRRTVNPLNPEYRKKEIEIYRELAEAEKKMKEKR